MARRKNAVTGPRSFQWLVWLGGVFGFMVVNIAVIQLIIRGLISWGQFLVTSGVVLVLGLVLGQVYVVPPLAPVQALARIRDELADLELTVTPDSSALEVTVGSDVTFRRRGAGSQVGWRALPLRATFRAGSGGTGCRITADARKNLGWYPQPSAAVVADEVRRRHAALIQRAMRATER